MVGGDFVQNLTVKPARESNVITVSYESTDPQFAAALANGYAESFIDTTAGLRTDPARSFNAILMVWLPACVSVLSKLRLVWLSFRR